MVIKDYMYMYMGLVIRHHKISLEFSACPKIFYIFYREMLGEINVS